MTKSNEFTCGSSVQQQVAARGGHICQCLSRIATIRSNRPVTIYNGERRRRKTITTTGRQFVETVVSLAQGLSELGIKAGDTIAIAALNSDLYLQWLLAVAFVGGIAELGGGNISHGSHKSSNACVGRELSQYMVQLGLYIGASHVFIPKFEPDAALQAIQQHHVTAFITVPAMMFDLISFINKNKNKSQSQSQKQTAEDQQNGTCTGGLKSINKILNGGGGLSPELTDECAKMFPTAKLVSAYGMTETCSSLTFMTLYDPANKKSGDTYMISQSKSVNQVGVRVGKPAPHVELRISDEGSSPIGRIFTRGPHVMLKYWDQIMASDQGWIDTGDIGWIDDNGDLWLVGRTKDRIRSGGENIYPEEVESILCQHPGVSHILVVGTPDGRLSEMVVGCIRMKESWQWIEGSSNSLHKGELVLSTEILQTYCKEMNLSRFKIPKVFIVWSQPFPVTSTGKVRRNEVRRDAMSHLQLLSSKL